MSDLARFYDYARAFEVAVATDDFSGIARCFAADAVHRVEGCPPFAADDRGRDAVVAGLRASVEGLERRFDLRIPEILEGPALRDDGIWMRFGLRLRRAGLPELRVEGEHLVTPGEGGAIARIDEKLLGGSDAAAREYLERHAARLRPAGSAPPLPGPVVLSELRGAVERSLVRCYAAAKSCQDIEAALAVCHPCFAIETLPFGTRSADRDDSARQLALFFSVFPDYRAECAGLATAEEGLAWWGDVSMSFAGDFLDIRATGRSARLPAFSVYEFRDGLLARERFVFDLPALCEAIGVPLDRMTGALAALRAA
jgi:predicted ester cyclase